MRLIPADFSHKLTLLIFWLIHKILYDELRQENSIELHTQSAYKEVKTFSINSVRFSGRLAVTFCCKISSPFWSRM